MNLISDRKIYVGLATLPHQAASAVGLLKLARRGVLESGEYAYGHQYLSSPVSIALNNEYMPLTSTPMKLHERRLRDGGALPLTLRDALPDSWGRRVLEVQHGGALDDIDVLLLTNSDRVGAMADPNQKRREFRGDPRALRQHPIGIGNAGVDGRFPRGERMGERRQISQRAF